MNKQESMAKVFEHQFGAHVSMDTLAPKLKVLASHKRRGSISVALWGPPGVGKTSLTKQIADELGIGYRRYDLPTTDYIQLGGVPDLQPDAKGNKKAVRYPILDIPADGEGIFVLDDFTHAPQAVQNLALDLALEHRLNDAVLGSGWMLVLCANDTGNVFPMPPPVANRLLHFYVNADYNAFRRWSLAHGIRNEVIGYLDTRKEFLYQEPQKQEKAFPTPRSWVAFSTVLDMLCGEEDSVTKQDDEMVFSFCAASVGAPAASDFIAYIKTYAMIDFNKILTGEHEKLDNIVKNITRENSKEKHEMANKMALEFAILAKARSWWNIRALEVNKDVPKQFGNILKYLGPANQSLLIRDFAYIDGARLTKIIKEVKNNNELKFAEESLIRLGKIMSGQNIE